MNVEERGLQDADGLEEQLSGPRAVLMLQVNDPLILPAEVAPTQAGRNRC
jgi:hypothetical protein